MLVVRHVDFRNHQWNMTSGLNNKHSFTLVDELSGSGAFFWCRASGLFSWIVKIFLFSCVKHLVDPFWVEFVELVKV